MTTYVGKEFIHDPHIDFDFPHIASIYYVNDSDGDTIFYNQKTYDLNQIDNLDLQEYKMTTRDYVVEQRYSADQSAWARSNLWIHETVAQAVVAFQGLTAGDYLSDNFRGVRPIIEFKPGIEKYNFGVNHIAYVNHLIDDTFDPATQIVGQISYSHKTSGITTDWAPGSGYNLGDRVRVNMND